MYVNVIKINIDFCFIHATYKLAYEQMFRNNLRTN